MDILKKGTPALGEPVLLRPGGESYGTGQFYQGSRGRIQGPGIVVTSEIKSKDGIADSIRAFLGKGR